MNPYYEQDGITVYNCDCRDVLDELPKVDLVVTDPPYGIGESAAKNRSRGKAAIPKDYGDDAWDRKPISQELYEMVRYAGQYACIFGGNFYENPPSSAWLVWDKQNTRDFADCELAWTNYGCAVRIIHHMWNGMLRKGNEPRFHLTQQPLGVIKWAINLAPKSETIIDPFMGSGTTLRAAKDLGKKCIGIEIEEKYCEIAVKRLRQSVLPIFEMPEPKHEQLLFDTEDVQC